MASVEEPRTEPETPAENEEQAKLYCGLTLQTILKLTAVLILLLFIVLGLTVWDLDDRIRDVFMWLEDNRISGIAIYIGLYAGLTAVFFPSSILTLAGGAIYKFWGIPIVWFGACLGQTIAFFIARYLLFDIVKGWSSKYTVWKAINSAINENALKVTILVRLATVVPYSVANALLPITGISLIKYTIGSAIGILPGVALFVSIGRLASGIAEVTNDMMEERDNNHTILFVTVGVSIVVLVILVVLLTRYAKKALREQLEQAEGEEMEGTSSNPDLSGQVANQGDIEEQAAKSSTVAGDNNS